MQAAVGAQAEVALPWMLQAVHQTVQSAMSAAESLTTDGCCLRRRSHEWRIRSGEVETYTRQMQARWREGVAALVFATKLLCDVRRPLAGRQDRPPLRRATPQPLCSAMAALLSRPLPQPLAGGQLPQQHQSPRRRQARKTAATATRWRSRAQKTMWNSRRASRKIASPLRKRNKHSSRCAMSQNRLQGDRDAHVQGLPREQGRVRVFQETAEPARQVATMQSLHPCQPAWPGWEIRSASRDSN